MSAKADIEKKVIDAGVMTGTDVLTSAPTNIRGIDNVSYQMAWTGTPTGTFSFEVSNTSTSGTDGTWTVLTLATSPTNPAGSASNTGVDLNQLSFKWVRMKYTNSGSTGTLNVTVFGKAV